MLASFRRLSKSTLGTIIMTIFLLLIVASFAAGDVANLSTGGVGLNSSTLAKVGGETVTERDMSQELERRLTEVRQQRPDADYAALAADFDPLLQGLIDQATLSAFADRFGFNLSKKLVDAEIANIPGTKGLNGQFSDAAYQSWLAQQRMSDQQVRRLIRTGLLQQMLLTPVVANSRVPVGVATPYASMLLEARQGEIAIVPIAAFRAGLTPTDADLQRFYSSNRARYMVPEQRSLHIARITADQLPAPAPTDQEIAAYYKAHQDVYGTSDLRVISQAVVPDQKTAQAIAGRARGGATFAAAAAPAGLSAADVAVGPQKRQQFASLAGEKVAAAAFAAKAGEVVGPIQSDLGWHVVKIDSVQSEGGKSLAAARAEIVTKLSADKKKAALEDLVTKVQDAVDNGSNFAEAAAAAKLPVTQTPLLLANGTSKQDAAFRLPAELAPALKSGFDMEANDDPVVDSLGEDAGYALVAPAQIVAAAPAPLAQIKAQVANDWITQQASARARAVAAAIAAKVQRGMPLAQAVSQAGTPLPAPRSVGARRLDLTMSNQPVPEPVKIMFNLTQGSSRMVADTQSGALAIVKLNKIIPGNANLQTSLISQVQRDFTRAVADEYARQFVTAMRTKLGIKRNESAITATRKRIIGG
ncbi:MAG: peptidyl-prolyl cis-trans isomerase [Sphingomicrobium sp.]